MQTTKALLVAAFAVSCAFSSAQADALAEIEKFETCLVTGARSLDDLMSPASDIAAAVAAHCRPKWQAVLLVNSEPLSKMDAYPPSSVKEAALRTVLAQRREAIELRSKSAAPKAPVKPNRTM